MPRIKKSLSPLPKGFKYRTIDEAGADIRFDYLAGKLSTDKIAEKYHGMIVSGCTPGAIRAFIRRGNLPKIRKSLDRERKAARERARVEVQRQARQMAIRDRESLALQAAKELAEQERRAQRTHMERIGKEHDRAHEAISSMEVSPKNVGKFVKVIDDWDKVGRRIYNMDTQEDVNPHKRNIAYLTNINMIVDGEGDARDVEGEVIEASVN